MIETGQKYRIKIDFMDRRSGLDPGVNSDMKLLAGTTVTVIKQCSSCRDWYKVGENEWTWFSDWLEPLDEQVYTISDSELMSVLMRKE